MAPIHVIVLSDHLIHFIAETGPAQHWYVGNVSSMCGWAVFC